MLTGGKKTSSDVQFLKNICPSSFDNFVFKPSLGASGGLLVAWKGAFLEGILVFQNEFSMSLEMKSLFNGNYWLLTNVYAPCTAEGKRNFCEWFKNIQIQDEQNWLLVGDFNLIRSPESRNGVGCDINKMFLFNEAISALGLLEIPLSGKNSLGQTSNTHLFWNDWTGFLPQPLGYSATQIPKLQLWFQKCLITLRAS